MIGSAGLAGAERARAYLAVFDRPREPGMMVSVLHAGAVAFEWSCGLANIEADRPWTDDTRVHVASHTKLLTAYLLATLHAGGVLDLDAPLDAVLDDLPSSWRAVTLRQCLGNLSGLPFDERWAWVLGRDWRTPTCEAWLRAVSEAAPPLHPPGAVFLYNDTNFRLAVRAAERAAGRSFETLIDEVIFAPLAMGRSGFERAGAWAAGGKAATYAPQDGGFVRHTAYMALSGDGAVVSTLADLRRWAAALLRLARSGDSVIGAVRTPGMAAAHGACNYGLGAFLGRHRDVEWFGHSGAGAGLSMVWIAPDADLAVIVLANRSDLDPTLIALNVADGWLPADAPSSARSGFDAEAPPGALTGRFVDAEGAAWVDMDHRGDVLRLDALGDFSWLRQGGNGIWTTHDGRLACRFDAAARELQADGRRLRLRPALWRAATSADLGVAAGVYRHAATGAQVVVDGQAALLLVAGGPDAPWRLPIQVCDRSDVWRAGGLAVSVGAQAICIDGRGLSKLRYERLG